MIGSTLTPTKIVVLYYWQKFNKINGTLFYCYEYFRQLQQDKLISHEIDFIIIDIPDEDIKIMDKVLNEKYFNYKEDIFTTPLYYSRIKLFQQLKEVSKILFLDVSSYSKCNELINIKKNKIHLFVDNDNQTKIHSDVNTYGSYKNYQTYKNECYLKLGFQFMIPSLIINHGDEIFVSCPDNTLLPEKFKTGYLLKQSTKNIENLFNLISEIIYVHVGLDTNNRIIPEAYWHFKILNVFDLRKDIVDSIQLRYKDIQQNGLKNYSLTKDDLIIKTLLS